MALRKLPMANKTKSIKQNLPPAVAGVKTPINPIPYLDKHFPARKFHTRKHIHLWDNNFRVNFHCNFETKSAANAIRWSYFVTVEEVVPAIPITDDEFAEVIV